MDAIRQKRRLGPALRHTALLALPGFLSAVLLTLCFPGPGLWWLAWAALVPLYAALIPARGEGGGTSGRNGAVRAFLVGFGFGLFLHLVGMYWMAMIGGVPWAVLSVIEAGWFGLFGLVAALLLPRLPAWARPWLFAALWTLLEYARSTGRLAFPWFLLAATQTRPAALPIVQVVELTGQWGLSFAVAAANGLIVEAWRARETRTRVGSALGAVAVPAVLALWGVGALARVGVSEKTVAAGAADTARRTIAIAQGNVQKPARYSEEARIAAMQTYVDLTREAVAKYRPAFVLWPETVVPGDLLYEPWLYDTIVNLARETRTDLLVGAADVDVEARERRNSAFHFDANGLQRNRYDKQRLVPMGEFLLFRELLWSIYEKYGGFDIDFVPGTLPGLFPVGGYGTNRADIGMLICYESAFPAIARGRTAGGARLLVQMTSDQTFDGTSNPQQHADLAVLRAVENRRWFVRAGSTGLSEMLAPTGEVRAGLPSGVKGVIGGDVTLRSEKTLFVRWGDWFVGGCAALTALATLAAIRSSRRRPADATEPAAPSEQTTPSATAP